MFKDKSFEMCQYKGKIEKALKNVILKVSIQVFSKALIESIFFRVVDTKEIGGVETCLFRSAYR